MSSPAPLRTAPPIRSADPADVMAMLALMEPFVASGDLLPRTPVDLFQHLDRYLVAADGTGGVQGVGSLKPYSETLAEIQALAVAPSFQRAGLGRALVEGLLARARQMDIAEVFALTRRPGFFSRLGFAPAQKARFPTKIWLDCARCPRQHACDELAVHVLLRD